MDRYSSVIEAYLSGLETFVAGGGYPATVHSVASFPLSTVDAEVDRRLEHLGVSRALELRGLRQLAQAKLAHRLFEEWFSSDRWSRLARVGARPQRLLWMSSESGAETDCVTHYLEDLIAPETVHALSESTVAALLKRGLGSPALWHRRSRCRRHPVGAGRQRYRSERHRCRSRAQPCHQHAKRPGSRIEPAVRTAAAPMRIYRTVWLSFCAPLIVVGVSCGCRFLTRSPRAMGRSASRGGCHLVAVCCQLVRESFLFDTDRGSRSVAP